mgnify:CR=1 FL=1
MTDTEILDDILRMLKPEHPTGDKFINSLEKFRREIVYYIEINRQKQDDGDG